MFARKREAEIVTMPSEIEAATALRAEMREKRQSVDAEIARLQADIFNAAEEAGSDAIDLAANALLDGRTVTADLRPLNARLAEAQRQREIILRAENKAKERLARAKRGEAKRVVALLRPQHRETVKQMIAAARQLSRAIQAERDLLNQVPGAGFGSIQRCEPPSIGTLADANSSISWWLHMLGKNGFADLIAETADR